MNRFGNGTHGSVKTLKAVPGAREMRNESWKDGTLMTHTYPKVLVHCIFSTKNRSSSIPHDLREKLSTYFVGIGKGHDTPVLCAGGTANHAHLLIVLPATVSLAGSANMDSISCGMKATPRSVWARRMPMQ
jgi:REP element-mobilizing transposase RayT